MKIFKSKSKVEDFLDKEIAWRRKEIHDLKKLIRSKSNSIEVSTLIRGGIVLSYANWEGYIKGASQAYLSYVSFRDFAMNEVASIFLTLSVMNNLNKTKVFTEHTSRISCLLDSPCIKCKIPTENIIDTESNLNSKVLRKIMDIIGLDFSHFELKSAFLDQNILKNRNEIAHGELRSYSQEDFNKIADFVIDNMAVYKTLIQNALDTKSYLRESMRDYESI